MQNVETWFKHCQQNVVNSQTKTTMRSAELLYPMLVTKLQVMVNTSPTHVLCYRPRGTMGEEVKFAVLTPEADRSLQILRPDKHIASEEFPLRSVARSDITRWQVRRSQ